MYFSQKCTHFVITAAKFCFTRSPTLHAFCTQKQGAASIHTGQVIFAPSDAQ